MASGKLGGGGSTPLRRAGTYQLVRAEAMGHIMHLIVLSPDLGLWDLGVKYIYIIIHCLV